MIQWLNTVGATASAEHSSCAQALFPRLLLNHQRLNGIPPYELAVNELHADVGGNAVLSK